MAKTMKKRIFCGAICEQIIYNVADNADPLRHDPEKRPKKRFKTEEEYAKFKTEMARRKHYRTFQANYRAGDFFCTLTFDNDNEVFEWDVARKIRSKYRRSLKKINPDAVFRIYMGRGKTTHRIHFHMVAHGLTEEQIKGAWEWGTVLECKKLRKNCKYNGEDCGQDYRGLANYLFDHWKQEQGGHRYLATRNERKPEEEKPTEVKIRKGYSDRRPPKAPKGYRLILIEANQYGYLYCRYVADEIAEAQELEQDKKRGKNR